MLLDQKLVQPPNISSKACPRSLPRPEFCPKFQGNILSTTSNYWTEIALLALHPIQPPPIPCTTGAEWADQDTSSVSGHSLMHRLSCEKGGQGYHSIDHWLMRKADKWRAVTLSDSATKFAAFYESTASAALRSQLVTAEVRGTVAGSAAGSAQAAGGTNIQKCSNWLCRRLSASELQFRSSKWCSTHAEVMRLSRWGSNSQVAERVQAERGCALHLLWGKNILNIFYKIFDWKASISLCKLTAFPSHPKGSSEKPKPFPAVLFILYHPNTHNQLNYIYLADFHTFSPFYFLRFGSQLSSAQYFLP